MKQSIKKKQVHFYCSYWAPNGTSDLIVVDQDQQVIGYMCEALFGPRLSTTAAGETFGHEYFCVDGEWVVFVDAEEEPELVAHSDKVYPLSLKDVLGYLSESPVHSRFSQLRRLVAAARGAS